MTQSDRLQAFIARRNQGHLEDAAMKGGLGLAFSLVTFGGFWWIAWLMFGTYKQGWSSPIPLALVALYLGVATWSAWRGVDPHRDLRPLTAGEADKRALEAAVAEFAGVGGLQGVGTREGVAGCANWLIAGPKSVLEALAAWNKRVTLPPDLIEESAALLRQLPQPSEGAERAAVVLLTLGLADASLDGEGELILETTRRGREVVGQD